MKFKGERSDFQKIKTQNQMVTLVFFKACDFLLFILIIQNGVIQLPK